MRSMLSKYLISTQMHGAYCLLESLEQPDNFLEQVCMLESFHSVFIAKLISKDDVATSKTGRA